MRVKLLICILICFSCMAACHTAKDSPDPERQPAIHEHGAYILCEGNFGSGQGSVFYYDTSQDQAHVQDAYKLANGFAPGNVVESLFMHGDTAYLVVNNSNKVELLDAHTLRRLTLNSTLISPRYVQPLPNGRLAITDLYAQKISILDRKSLVTYASIPALGWTEQMCLVNNALYVANRKQTQPQATSLHEQILVVNPQTFVVEDSIKLNGTGPQEFVNLNDGTLITSLENDFTFSDKPSLVTINLMDKSLTHSEVATENGVQPIRLQLMDDWLFWLQGDLLCFQNRSGGAITKLQPFGASANLSSLCVIRIDSGMARILAADSRNYTSNGMVKDMVVDLTQGQIIKEKTVECGIIPGQITLF